MGELTYYPEVMETVHLLIVPTILIPLTMISVVISVIATFIAGLFGVKLKAEGPKRMLELLTRPRIILSALLFNGLFIGGVWLYQYINHAPSFIFNIKRINESFQNPISDYSYPDNLSTVNTFTPNYKKISNLRVKEEKSLKLPKGAFGHIALGGNTLFVGTASGHTYELKRKSLEKYRTFYNGTFISAGSIIWNNFLIHGEGVHATHHARIYFFNLKTGKYEKSFSTKGHTEVQPVLGVYEGENTLFFSAGGDGIYAIDPTTLEVKWHHIDGHTDSSVVFADDAVFIGTGRDKETIVKYRPYAISYDFKTGAHRWKRELPASSWMQPVIYNNDICFVYGEIYFKSELGGIACFDQRNGMPALSFRNLAPIVSIPVVVGNEIFFADTKGKICSLDGISRRLKWCYQTNKNKGVSYAGITYDPIRDLLIYPSKYDGLYVFDRKSGKHLTHLTPEGWDKNYANITVAQEGWYSVDMKGTVRFFSVEI